MRRKVNDFSMLDRLPQGACVDLDNTLYPYAPCHAAALKAVAALGSIELSCSEGVFQKAYDEARRAVHRRLAGTASSHNRLLYFKLLLEGLGASSRVDLALSFYRTYWDEFIGAIRLYPGVTDFLSALRQHGVRTALVTDLTADVQLLKLDRLELAGCFDAIVTSEEAGREKPDRAPFDLAVERMQCGPGTLWVVGDSSSDVNGGRAIGAVTLQKAEAGGDLSDSQADCLFDDFRPLFERVHSLAEGKATHAGR